MAEYFTDFENLDEETTIRTHLVRFQSEASPKTCVSGYKKDLPILQKGYLHRTSAGQWQKQAPLMDITLTVGVCLTVVEAM